MHGGIPVFGVGGLTGQNIFTGIGTITQASADVISTGQRTGKEASGNQSLLASFGFCEI